MRRILFLTLLSFITVLSGSAANIVANPGFEIGGLSAWNSSFWEASNFAPQTGVYSAITLCGGPACLDPNSPDSSPLFQDLPTVPFGVYSLSFWFNTGLGPSASELRVLWGGVTVADYLNLDTQNQYQLAVIPTLVATSAMTRLEFYAREDSDVMYLDSISVDPVVLIPEPATALLFVFAVPILFLRRKL